MKRRVVITGLGAITPIGNTVEEFWNGIKNGTVGIGPITKFDTTEYKVKIAAEVKDFVAKERMDFKASKRMETFSQYAVAAAKEACADAGFEIEKEDPYRCGVIIGSGIGSLQQIEKQYTTILEKGPGRVAPLMVPMMISNMAAGNVSIQLGLKGKCTNVVTACATGTNCIGDAAKDVVVNSTKSMIGHLLGAAGAVECIVTVKSIQDGFIHQTVGTRECDEECDLNYAVGAPVEKEIKCALTNSLGFGGHNATLLLKKYEG